MRIIGEIPHPHLKISIFKMGERLSVKFENALFEQTYKFGADDRFNTVEAIQTLIDETFIGRVQEQMQAMNETRLAGINRNFPVPDTDEFDEII
jgi:hypothetical protein